MRIATFNILNGRSPADGRVDVDRFRSAVGSLDADLLGLQEVDRHQPRSQGADLTMVAAEALQARYHRFAAALVGTPGARWRTATDAEPGNAPAYGIALLSRYDVLASRVVRLPGAPIPVPHLHPGRRRPAWRCDEPRVALVAAVDAPMGVVEVVTTHLSFLRPWNSRQLRRLLTALGPRQRPIVLLGDLNLGPRAATRITGMTPLATGPTFPVDDPRRQLDHVLADGLPAPLHAGTLALPVSDHRALVVDLPG